ncbi:MAG: glycosyl hydrolase [Bacteroidetes bacterium]|nr:glycosyl hydrolase [Bacteroidota bacterium]
MATKRHRLLFTLLALVAGIIIVLVLILMGDKSKGPLENMLNKAGSVVTNIENNIIVEKRSTQRKSKLLWLKPYFTNPDSLRTSKYILMGAYDNLTNESFESIIDLEDTLKTTFPLIHIYTAWGSKPEEGFPRLKVQAILELGSIPVITWEPWLSDFDGKEIPGLRAPSLRDQKGLADIAKGLYDSYIKEWAKAAKDVNAPIFLRFGHEMNDPYRYPWGPHNNNVKDFLAAWRHVHKVFKVAGADNVLWIWSPHPSYGYFDYYYPGDRYVDYVGVNVLNYGTVAAWSKWWTFREIFGAHYKELARFHKPIMITEFSSLAVGGSRSKWFEEAFNGITENYPLIKSVLFFHFSEDKTTTQQAVDWTIKSDKAVVETIIKQRRLWPDSVKPPSDRLPGTRLP